jgi:FkbM family methyltransferase
MMRAVKNFIKEQLVRRGRHLSYVPVESVTGFDLGHDLRLLVPKPNPVIFDVGANVGQSVESFLEIFEAPIITSFEPSSACIRELESKFADCSGVTVRQCALGPEIGACELEVYEFSVLNSVLPMDRSRANRFNDRKPIGKETVPVLTLDRVAQEYKTSHIDVLKIDTQGYDLQVLRGGESLWSERRVSVVQIELNFLPMYEGQAAADEVTSFLVTRGFSLVDYYEIYRQEQAIAWCTALFRLTSC